MESKSSKICNIDLINKTKDNFKNDIDRYNFILSITPDDIAILNNKGRALCSVGKLKEGIELFDRVIKLNPQDVESNYNKGVALTDLNKIDEAIECLEKSILFNQKSSPTYDPAQLADSYNGKGMALARKKEFKRAIVCFNIGLSIDPNNLGIINNRSAALNESGIFDESIKGYNQIDSKKNHDNVAYQFLLNNKGTTFLLNNRFSEAIHEFNKSIAFKQGTAEYIEALDGKAQALMQIEKYDDAFLIYNKLIKEDQNNKSYHNSLGNIYFLKNDHETALKSYRKAIFIDPSYTQSIIGCANSLSCLNRFEESLPLYDRAIKLWKNDIGSSLEVVQRNRDIAYAKSMYKKKQNEDFDDLHKILLKFNS